MKKLIFYNIFTYSILSLCFIIFNNEKCKYVSYKPSLKCVINNPLIFGFAVGYKIEKMNLFISSLRKNGYYNDIIMGISYSDFSKEKKYISYNKIIPIFIDSEWPFYSSHNKKYPLNYSFLYKCSIKKRIYNNHKWNVYRFSIMNCWMKIYGSIYSHILSIDVRDVIFQGNPFVWNFKDALYLFEEDSNKILIKDNPINLIWVKRYKHFDKVINNHIINSGSIFGTNKYFILLLTQFYKFINDNNIITNEQGSLNYAYYTGYFRNIKFLKHENQKGVILTTGIDLPFVKKFKIQNYTIYNKDGSIPLIVHQYDRCKEFKNMYLNKYYNDSWKFF